METFTKGTYRIDRDGPDVRIVDERTSVGEEGAITVPIAVLLAWLAEHRRERIIEAAHGMTRAQALEANFIVFDRGAGLTDLDEEG